MRDVSMDDGLGVPGADSGGAVDAGTSGEDGSVEEPDVGFDFLESVGRRAGNGAAPGSGGPRPPRLSEGEVAEFRSRWADIQASFIDDPNRACEQADNLVDLVLTRLIEALARECKDLVRTWDRGSEPTDTENLRVAMKGYRGLIDRLLTTEV